MPTALIAEVEAWAAANETSRSDAFRRLVELGLSVDKPQAQTPARSAAKAKSLAGRAINGLADQQASTEEQADRKRDLISGPEEFREVRVDRAKKK
jgi:hypothetical protein